MTIPDPRLLDRVRARLADQRSDITPGTVAAALRAEGHLLGDSAMLELVDTLHRDSVGAGPLEDLLCLEGVTDVLVNGPGDVYVDDGQGLRRTHVTFTDDTAVRRLAQRLAAASGRRLDDASPYVDVRMPNGTRLHAVLAPLAWPGTCLSLRVPAQRTMSLEQLASSGLTDDQGVALLLDLVRSRLAFLVSGGTGSGKTTLLAALLGAADPEERIVMVEDSSELRLHHPHVVSLESRPSNVEGVGAVALRELVRQALRMRPDRLVVGEVRGAEVVDMLAAMNTGHEGGCGTVHANAAGAVPARLEALGVAAGLTRDAVHAQLAAALQVVVHLRRGVNDKVRRLAEVGVVERRADGWVDVIPAVNFESGKSPTVGPGGVILARLLSR
ncbi:MAG: TadA family conjugal transfer-associated ATPase [Nocardioidaceae bacterium]